MADGWISELLRQFFRYALISGQHSEGAGGWDGGEGSKMAQNTKELEKPPK